jgi:hypothetical protein
VLKAHGSQAYHSGAKYWTHVQYLLPVFTLFEVLEGPIHGGIELGTSNCNYRHEEQCKNIIQLRDICWRNKKRGSIFSAATVGSRKGSYHRARMICQVFETGIMVNANLDVHPNTLQPECMCQAVIAPKAHINYLVATLMTG